MALVSVNADDLVAVVRLACLTEDRANAEQRSLLAVAERCDTELNKHTTTNKRCEKNRAEAVEQVVASRSLGAASPQAGDSGAAPSLPTGGPT